MATASPVTTSEPASVSSPRTTSAALIGALRRVRALLPGVSDYGETRRSWPKDLLAGVTVGIVALPLALGFGVSSGLTAEQGLITAIVAGVLAAIFGGSHVQISGPTGAMAVVLVPIVATQGAEAVVAVTLIAGIIVVAAGLLRLGRAVSFIPWPVIEGFTLGIAAIIFLQQVPFVTTPSDSKPGEHSTNALVAAGQLIGEADWSYLPYSLAAVAIVAVCMIFAPKIHSSIPGSLVGIVIVTVLAALVPNPLASIGEIPRSLPLPSVPAIDLGAIGGLLPAAGTIAALAAIESLLSARVASSMSDAGAYHPDRELVGQGIASIGSSLFGGMPATGAIARTSVNIRAGGRTRLASIVHALVLLAIVLAAAAPVSQIPARGSGRGPLRHRGANGSSEHRACHHSFDAFRCRRLRRHRADHDFLRPHHRGRNRNGGGRGVRAAQPVPGDRSDDRRGLCRGFRPPRR